MASSNKAYFSPVNLCVIMFGNKALSLLFLCLLCSGLGAQQSDPGKPGLVRRYWDAFFHDTSSAADPQLLIYPTLGFAPETSWEIGFSTLYVYYAQRDTNNRLSEVSGFTFYTLEDQFGLWFDHALYGHRDKWFFLGRTRLQSFPLLYFGQGPDAPAQFQALVEGNYLLWQERVLRRIRPNFFGGLNLDFQQLSAVNFKGNEAPYVGERPRGAEGSRNLGLGLALVYDNRHNVLNVREGFFSELSFLQYDRLWGSDFEFTRLTSDTRWFHRVNRKDVFAAQVFGQFTPQGRPPFNQLALMGGENLMRGYYLGRYRDRNLLAAQVEYRSLPLPFAKRLGAAAFVAAGQVFPNAQQLRMDAFLPTAGLGLRYLLFFQKDINVRLDCAFTREGMGVYFFIGEAF